jgi:single-stranded DNA-binding protein
MWVTAVGRVVKDPFTNDPTGGKKKFTSVTIVRNKHVGQNPDGSPKFVGQFLKVMSFDRTAEMMAELKKNDTIYVHGNLELDEYEDKEGNKRSGMACTVITWNKVTPYIENGAAAAAASEDAAPATDDGEEDPF